MNGKKEKQTLIIAEVSANHNRKFSTAVELIRKAKLSGADAVKFQAYTPDTITINSKNKNFMIKHAIWGNISLYDLYKKAYTPWDWFPKLKKVADNEGIIFFATAFDKTSVDMLESIKVPMHKISSFEIVDIPLIKYVSSKKKPLLISTGMASLNEIKDAVNVAKKNGATNISLFKCVSAYPAQPEDMNLTTIQDMKKKFKCDVGLSDHSVGIEASVSAVAYGATLIEKHFVLSKRSKGLDRFFSITPLELSTLVETIRKVEKMHGEIKYGSSKNEIASMSFRRSLFVVKDIKKGEIFTKQNIKSIRPAGGVSPKNYTKILGRKSEKNIKAGTPLNIKI
ncbi:MAG: pseudaminic acid synthase [Candidatus Omnitrophica bacterium]|nr:pseudaminic acid synthase [Candidatus Omnitrophota bacterium]